MRAQPGTFARGAHCAVPVEFISRLHKRFAQLDKSGEGVVDAREVAASGACAEHS